MGQADKNLDFDASEKLLGSLVRELKTSLTYIARRGEYLSKKHKIDLAAIENSAMDSLSLIDSYLLCARSEYGQQLLPLQPVGPGAILYEVAQQSSVLSLVPDGLVIKSEFNEPIMVNKRALIVALCSLVKTVSDASGGQADLHIVSKKRRRGDLFIGVFSDGYRISPDELTKSLNLSGKANVAFAGKDFSSGVDLAIAGQLAASMGGDLLAVKHKGRGGIGIKVNKSEQLSIV